MKLLKELIKGKDIIFFNAGYDLPIIRKYRCNVPEERVKDVMIACHLHDINGYKRNAGLKAQAEQWLSLPTVEMIDIISANLGKKIKKDEIDFLLLTLEQQRIYGCQDADITLMLWQLPSIQKAVEKAGEIWTLENEVIQPVIEMEKNGIGCDLKIVAQIDKILETECGKCSEQVHTMALRDCATHKDDEGAVCFDNEELQRLSKKKGLNLGSFKQKQILLFDELHMPHTRKTDTGYSTDSRAMVEIEGEHDIIPLIMRYNQLNSRRNSFTKTKLAKLADPVTGRIHPSLWSTGTKSGRFSCSNPNLQGVSKDHKDGDPAQLRTCFIPSRGNILTAADYSQIELRIPASLCHEPVLYDAYMAGNVDVHAQTACSMYDVTLENVESWMRDISKIANFSILNGISGYTLSARNRHTLPTAQDGIDIIDKWWAALPVLNRWANEIKRQIRVHGEAVTFFGRVRPLPDAVCPSVEIVAETVQNLMKRPWTRNKTYEEVAAVARRNLVLAAERQGLSHVVQGTAADIMKIALVRMHRAIQKDRPTRKHVKMILTVHDELLFDHPPEMSNDFYPMIREAMEFKQLAEGWVPLVVDIGSGANWAIAH
jgi:DNA polymerase-1